VGKYTHKKECKALKALEDSLNENTRKIILKREDIPKILRKFEWKYPQTESYLTSILEARAIESQLNKEIETLEETQKKPKKKPKQEPTGK